MISALGYDEMNEKVYQKYNCTSERIIGIMFARYEIKLTSNIINECYNFWNLESEEKFDIYWLGYGEYISPSKSDSQNIIMNFSNNENRVYFSTQKYIEFINKMKCLHKYKYKDRVQLMLVSCRNGKIDFKKNMIIDLESNSTEIREVMYEIINECKTTENLKTIIYQYTIKKIFSKIKNISINDLTGVTSLIN